MSETPIILGLNDPDLYGELPKHVVALTEDEIDTLWQQHVYAANRTRPRKRVKQSDRDAQSHAWYSDRAALFERLLPKEEPEEPDDPGRAPITMDDVEAAQAADGMMVGGEAVDIRHPLDRDVEPILGRDGEILGYHEVSPKEESPGPAYLPLRQAGQS